MSENDATQLLRNPATSWDAFYARNELRFFKDRQWLLTEFPELLSGGGGDSAESSTTRQRRTVLEVGCGVGNTVFPLLAHCKRNGITDVFVYCCDYSSTAIELVRAHADYDTSMCHAFVWDITVCFGAHKCSHLRTPQDASASIPVQAGTIDAVSMIFVLSAIAPEHHRTAIANVSQLMRERTGVILFRDYGMHDLTQLRAKSGRCVRGTDALYARGDSTLVYYFTQVRVCAVHLCAMCAG